MKFILTKDFRFYDGEMIFKKDTVVTAKLSDTGITLEDVLGNKDGMVFDLWNKFKDRFKEIE